MEEVRKNVCSGGGISRLKPVASACLTLAILSGSVYGASGTWNTATSGQSWATNTNWAGNTIADGSGNTADFSQVNVTTAPTLVNLNGNRTIGSLIFGDTDTSSAAGWRLQVGTGGVLTLAGANPTITVNALGGSANARIDPQIAGTSGFTKDGTGTLVLTNASNSISGSVSVTNGILQLNNATLTSATSVAINGGTLVCATSNANAIGGTISFGGGLLQFNNAPGTDYSSQFSTAASQNYRVAVTAGAGSATFSSGLTSSGGSLTKEGPGTLILGGLNSYTGNTLVSAGTLALADNAQLRFNIGASGINNKIQGTGTLTLNGDFNFDLSGAATTGSWNIVDVGTLLETFSSTFSVVGFTDAGGNLWTKTSGGATYTFDEADGTLTAVVPEPGTLGAAVLLAGVSAVRRRRMAAN